MILLLLLLGHTRHSRSLLLLDDLSLRLPSSPRVERALGIEVEPTTPAGRVVVRFGSSRHRLPLVREDVEPDVVLDERASSSSSSSRRGLPRIRTRVERPTRSRTNDRDGRDRLRHVVQTRRRLRWNRRESRRRERRRPTERSGTERRRDRSPSAAASSSLVILLLLMKRIRRRVGHGRRRIRFRVRLCRDLSLSVRAAELGCDEWERFSSLGRRRVIGIVRFLGIKVGTFALETEHGHLSHDVAVLRVVRRVHEPPEVLGADRDDLHNEDAQPEIEGSVEILFGPSKQDGNQIFEKKNKKKLHGAGPGRRFHSQVSSLL